MFKRNIDQSQTNYERQNDSFTYRVTEDAAVAVSNSTTLQNGDHNKVPGWIIYYALLMLVGISGNSLTSYILVTRPFMKEKYIFTTSLCIAHILFCVLVLPVAIGFTASYEHDIQTPCDVIVCFLLGVASYSMLTQAVRRFLALCERFRFANFTYQGKIMNTVLIWVVSIVLALPYIVSDQRTMYTILLDFHSSTSNTDVPVNNTDGNEVTSTTSYSSSRDSTITTTHLPDMTSHTTGHHWLWIYSTTLLGIQIVLPSVTSLALHSQTLRGILKRPNQTHWVKEIQITKQHIIMQIIFLICWVPVSVLNLMFEYVSINVWILHGFRLLAVSNCVYYPILYYIINAHIKREMKVWFVAVTSPFREVGTTAS